MTRYEVEVISTGMFTGTLDPRKLQEILNRRADQGWTLARTIKEERRRFLMGQREAHFLIFERAVAH